jgi:C-terminal processing protease CtpA/Prc
VERLNKPFLGVTLAERVEPSTALIVESLFVGGPADAGGIKLGDVFVEVGGHVVSNFVEMRQAMKESAKMGDMLSLVVMRGAETVSTSIHVMTADKEFSDLTDIFFDLEKHTRVSKSESHQTSIDSIGNATKSGPSSPDSSRQSRPPPSPRR